MTAVWGILGFLLLIVWVITVVDLFRRRLSGGTTALWLLAIIILPYVGAIAYWALRKPPEGEAERIAAAEAALRNEPRPPVDGSRLPH